MNLRYPKVPVADEVTAVIREHDALLGRFLEAGDAAKAARHAVGDARKADAQAGVDAALAGKPAPKPTEPKAQAAAEEAERAALALRQAVGTHEYAVRDALWARAEEWQAAARADVDAGRAEYEQAISTFLQARTRWLDKLAELAAAIGNADDAAHANAPHAPRPPVWRPDSGSRLVDAVRPVHSVEAVDLQAMLASDLARGDEPAPREPRHDDVLLRESLARAASRAGAGPGRVVTVNR